jgi:hypothetical protein
MKAFDDSWREIGLLNPSAMGQNTILELTPKTNTATQSPPLSPPKTMKSTAKTNRSFFARFTSWLARPFVLLGKWLQRLFR